MAEALGRGGQARVVEASGMSSSTGSKRRSPKGAGVEPSDRNARRWRGQASDREAARPAWALDELVHPSTAGTPMSALRWTLKSTYELAQELQRQGYRASAELVRACLHQMGYSLQAPAKQNEGTAHPDRDGQFGYINDLVTGVMAVGEPVISVDTKKKELIGNYANEGANGTRRGTRPGSTCTTSPIGPSVSSPRPSPMGSTTSATTRAGSRSATPPTPPSSRSSRSGAGGTRWAGPASPMPPLLITADAGGSNGYRVRAFKSTWPSSRPRPASPSRSVTIHPARRSGTRSSTACSASSPSTGGPAAHRHSHHRRAHRRDQDQDRPHHQGRLRPNWYPTGVKISDAELRRHPAPPQTGTANGTTRWRAP